MGNRVFLIILFCCLAVRIQSVAQSTYEQEQITTHLISDGFENVRVLCKDNVVVATVEDNHYHGIYYGLAQALRIISPSDDKDRDITLIVLKDKIPQITIHANHLCGTWDISKIEYGGQIPDELSSIQPEASTSSFKADFVLYPSFSLTTDRYDRMWSSHFAVNPAFEMSLWPGSQIILQAHIPIWDNYVSPESYQYNRDIGIQRAVYSQQIVSSRKFNLSSVVGMFANQRYGMDLKAFYHLNKCLDLGVKGGYTGFWKMYDCLEFGNLDRMTLLGYLGFYEPNTNLQVELHAGRFLYEDKGARMDVCRHYADYTIGLYGSFTEYGTSFGFSFSAPVGPRRMGKHRHVRLRMLDALYFSFDENTNLKKGYSFKQIGRQYNALPYEQNNSSRFWQPEFLHKYILKELRKELK